MVAARIEVLKDAEANSEEERELQELTRQIIEFERKKALTKER